MSERPDAELVKTRLLQDLKVLNSDLRRNGLEPLITLETATALDLDNLRSAVKATGDFLVDAARKMRGL